MTGTAPTGLASTDGLQDPLARRWVLPAQESEHVRGGAVDVGPEAGVAWLRSHGVRFGLCQRYVNEPWHFERLAGAKGSKCPALEPYA